MIELLANLEQIFVSSPFLGLGISFLAGLLVSFSPCIYPLIPITLGVVGATSIYGKSKGFIVSLTFVLGIACVYTALGIFSSVFGILLGNFFINPFTYLVLFFLFLFLGLNYAGIINFRIPILLHPENKKGHGLHSVFIIGMISALAIVPCNFPVLGAILTLISLKKNVIYGGTALFLFSLGYGSVLVVLGTFTSLIKKLPKSGNWLNVMKRGVGVIFGIMSVYFLIKFIFLIR